MSGASLTVQQIIERVRFAGEFLAGHAEHELTAKALLDFSDGGKQFEAALGLARGWREVESHRVIRRAIIEISDKHLRGLRARKLADEIGAALRRYRAARWPRDRDARARPAALEGLLYDLCAHGCSDNFWTLRNIINDLRGQRRASHLPKQSAILELTKRR